VGKVYQKPIKTKINMAQTNLNLTIKAENIIADVKWQFAKKGQKMNKHEIINHIIETWKSK